MLVDKSQNERLIKLIDPSFKPTTIIRKTNRKIANPPKRHKQIKENLWNYMIKHDVKRRNYLNWRIKDMICRCIEKTGLTNELYNILSKEWKLKILNLIMENKLTQTNNQK